MGLQGFIGKLQNIGTQFYLVLAECFRDNKLVSDIWVAMAHEKEEQTKCLRALPSSFWTQLKDSKYLIDAAQTCLSIKSAETDTDRSLGKCFERVFCFEEPIILQVYAPIIKSLRRESKDQGLDFYIMIKAHVARLTRVIQSFAGNPVLIQRSTTLLESFEQAVQAPEPQPTLVRTGSTTRKKAGSAAAAKSSRVQREQSASKKVSVQHRPLGSRAKQLAKRAKPIVKKLVLSPRRARR